MKTGFIFLHTSGSEYYQTTLADSLLYVLQQNVAGTDIHTGWDLRFFNFCQTIFVNKKSYLTVAFDCFPTSVPATVFDGGRQIKGNLHGVITGNEHHFTFSQCPWNQITPPVLHIRIESTGEIIAQLCRYVQSQFAQILPEFFQRQYFRLIADKQFDRKVDTIFSQSGSKQHSELPTFKTLFIQDQQVDFLRPAN